jgi:hypothetical protein
MYSILQNNEGELMLLIGPCSRKPDCAFFCFDGSPTALLMLSLFTGVAIRNMDPETIEALEKASEIHVVEKDGEQVVRDYIATIERVSDVQALIL